MYIVPILSTWEAIKHENITELHSFHWWVFNTPWYLPNIWRESLFASIFSYITHSIFKKNKNKQTQRSYLHHKSTAPMSKQQKLKSLSTCWFNFKTKLVESFFCLACLLVNFLNFCLSLRKQLPAINFYICPINGSFCLSCHSIAQMNMKLFFFVCVVKRQPNCDSIHRKLTYNPKYCLINQANRCHLKFRLLLPYQIKVVFFVINWPVFIFFFSSLLAYQTFSKKMV